MDCHASLDRFDPRSLIQKAQEAYTQQADLMKSVLEAVWFVSCLMFVWF